MRSQQKMQFVLRGRRRLVVRGWGEGAGGGRGGTVTGTCAGEDNNADERVQPPGQSKSGIEQLCG